jgi:hypothetical protein
LLQLNKTTKDVTLLLIVFVCCLQEYATLLTTNYRELETAIAKALDGTLCLLVFHLLCALARLKLVSIENLFLPFRSILLLTLSLSLSLRRKHARMANNRISFALKEDQIKETSWN